MKSRTCFLVGRQYSCLPSSLSTSSRAASAWGLWYWDYPSVNWSKDKVILDLILPLPQRIEHLGCIGQIPPALGKERCRSLRNRVVRRALRPALDLREEVGQENVPANHVGHGQSTSQNRMGTRFHEPPGLQPCDRPSIRGKSVLNDAQLGADLVAHQVKAGGEVVVV